MAITTLNIKIEDKDKQAAQQLARDLGLSLSGVLKALLKDFIRTKRLNVALQGAEEALSDWAKEELRKSEADIKTGRVISFKTPEEELAYLDQLIARNESKPNKN